LATLQDALAATRRHLRQSHIATHDLLTE